MELVSEWKAFGLRRMDGRKEAYPPTPLEAGGKKLEAQ